MEQKTELETPGNRWIKIVRQNGTPEFAAHFAVKAELHASVLDGKLVGADAIGAFFKATSNMYDEIAFGDEARSGNTDYVEWSGRVFGREVGGVTIISRGDDGLITRVKLYHRPHGVLNQFSTELLERIDKNVHQEF